MKTYSFNGGLLTESIEGGNSPISQVLLGSHYFPGIQVPHLPPLRSATLALSKSHLFTLGVSLTCPSLLYLHSTHTREGFGGTATGKWKWHLAKLPWF